MTKTGKGAPVSLYNQTPICFNPGVQKEEQLKGCAAAKALKPPTPVTAAMQMALRHRQRTGSWPREGV